MCMVPNQRSSKLSIVVSGVFVTLLLVVAVPQPVSADLWGSVGCTGANCTMCHLVSLGNALILWLIGILFVLFGVVAVIAGFKLVTSAGNPAGKQAAKDRIINALIGIIIVLAAWMIVDTIMQYLDGGTIEYNSNAMPWNRIECSAIVTDPAGVNAPEYDFSTNNSGVVTPVGSPITGAANNSQTGGNSGFQGAGGNEGTDTSGTPATGPQ